MSKKWYNYFVTIESTENEQPSVETERKPVGPAQSAAQTVAHIAASVNTEVKFTAPVANPMSFAEIYDAAAIHPAAHGYTILKVAEMLDSELIRSLPPDVKRRSILVALEAVSVKVTDIIEDAVKRDRALDTFERVQQKAVTELENKKTQENRKIQEDIDKLVAEKQARIQANTSEVVREKERFKSWCAQKQKEEKRIADAVSHFVAENPITVSGEGDTGPAAKPQGT
jgi:hypothetical protein